MALKIHIPVFLIFIGLFCSCVKYKSADIIVHNGTIYSCDSEFTVYEAMAIKDGKIVELGPEHQIRNKYTADEMLDLKKRTITPTFFDAHSYILAKSLKKNSIDYKDFEGVNIDSSKLNYVYNIPEKQLKTVAFENKNFVYRSISGNMVIPGSVNEIVFNSNGRLFISSKDSVGQVVLFLEQEQLSRFRFEQMEAELFKNGYSGCSSFGVESNTAEKLLAKNPTGYHQFILAGNDENFNWLTKVGRTDSGNIHIKGLSYFIDGGFGSKDALLKEKYADTDLIGTQFTDSSLINEISDLCASLRFQLTFHAYGDSGFSLAARQMGDALESVNDNRWRIEHNQFITAADYNLLKKFSILPSVQPTQAQTDKKQFATILGTQRNCETYNFKKLLNQNQFLASGSLYPIGELNPIEQLIALLNSENQCNHGIDKKAALKAITIWPAMLAFFDSETGSLEVGKNADFVVLNLDPVKAETKTLEQLKIETTHIKGIQKFSRN